MSITNSIITTELISDFSGGRLDLRMRKSSRRPSITTKSSRQLSQMRVGSTRECTYGWQHRQ